MIYFQIFTTFRYKSLKNSDFVISTKHFVIPSEAHLVISTKRSAWRNLDKMLIFNRFLAYALRATLEMTVVSTPRATK